MIQLNTRFDSDPPEALASMAAFEEGEQTRLLEESRITYERSEVKRKQQEGEKQNELGSKSG